MQWTPRVAAKGDFFPLPAATLQTLGVHGTPQASAFNCSVVNPTVRFWHLCLALLDLLPPEIIN